MMNYLLCTASAERRGALDWRNFRCAEKAVIIYFHLHIAVKMEQSLLGDD